MRTRALLISLVALSISAPLLLSGCGGDDSTSATTATEPAVTQPPGETTPGAEGSGEGSTDGTASEKAEAGAGGADTTPDGDEGGSGKGANPDEAYATEVEAALDRFTGEARTIGAQLFGARDGDEFLRLMDEGQANISTAIADLESVQPPEGAEEGHDQLIAAFEAFSSDLADVADVASAGDGAGLPEAAAQLQGAAREFGRQVAEAMQKLLDAGVDVRQSPLG